MNRTVIASSCVVAVMLGLTLILDGCALSRQSIPPAQLLTAAKAQFIQGDFSSVVETIKPARDSLRGAPEEPEALYMLGRSLYQGVCEELGSCDLTPNRGMGFLTDGQRKDLTAARDSLLAAGDLAPQASFAPEAFHLAARTMDYGFLQLFDRAMELYRWCYTSYPGTEAAAKSRERYGNLKKKLQGISGGAHGE